MSNFALLSKEAQDILENSRIKFLNKNLERIEAMQKDVAGSTLAGIARQAILINPEIRYVTIQRPGKAGSLRLLKVTEVLDAERNPISNYSGRDISWRIETLLMDGGVHKCVALEAWEYDFVALANRQF